MKIHNRLKIVNDPVYGFIHIPNTFILALIEHPYFQRLCRISQMGLSYLVYPGARHTRFHHALGCMYLMQQAVQTLRYKQVEITPEEEEGLYIAILLHDIGHGPFSHAMEHSIVEGISHEEISLAFMEELNRQFEGRLSVAIEIFQKKYKKQFMNQLISSQLDMDRLDYLKRDSFYSGVSEGNINSERIIAMLTVKNDTLIVDEKGIYSIEEFLVARRLMYWQVYLHKTSIGAEFVLIRILARVKELIGQGKKLPMTTALRFFVENHITKETFDRHALHLFAQLDDYDIISGLKEWQYGEDWVLAKLSQMILNRDLLRVKLYKSPVEKEKIQQLLQETAKKYDLPEELAHYFVFTGEVSNTAYRKDEQNILIYTKNNKVIDVTQASDQMNLDALSTKVTKYYLCAPK
ncbi:HD domain-containing protein [Capnocytophaga sp. oral taxon 338]|uniref:HD domain-containing protein n=1 Tax=Capnocytophaga sp. oral taxon 338 TaxID=710239 RepID=UPI00058C7394|nr:HD domain-containing protein [Capnocytophaga sp. oral taxon 338]